VKTDENLLVTTFLKDLKRKQRVLNEKLGNVLDNGVNEGLALA
jgi:hypothetical protein